MTTTPEEREALLALAREAERLGAEARLGLAFGVDRLRLRWIARAIDDIAAAVAALGAAAERAPR